MKDIIYQSLGSKIPEIQHAYGEGVHILSDRASLTLLARLCQPETRQPAVSRLMARLYTTLVGQAVNHCFPRTVRRLQTRMRSLTERGIFEAELLDPDTPVVTVAIARAGTLPSQVCYEYLTDLLNPDAIRQDHMVMSRTTDEQSQVVGAKIWGEKIGGSINDRIVLFPDPMGATGNSLSNAITFLQTTFGSAPAQLITLNLIVTPEFIRRLKTEHPQVQIFSFRLDRGMSPPDVLATTPGVRWEEESGLTDDDYIVPGAGGFGEVMNNAWV